MKEMQSYLVPGISLPIRLLMFAAFAAAGAAIQIFLGTGAGFLLGALVMVPGLILVWARGYRNKPMDLGFEDWQPSSASEFDRIRSNLSLTKQKQFPVIYRSGFGVFILVALIGLAAFLLFAGSGFLAVFCFDAAVLLLPFLFSGNVRLWTPRELAFKMHGFDAIVRSEPTEGGEIIITPYLRLDKDKEGRQIPEDIRLMVEPRRKPADFLGVQFQVAVNKGPNGAVPYMYGVFLCKGKGETYRWIDSQRFPGMVREPGEDKEYGYIVVRQETSGTGYHTTDADVLRLYRMVKETLLALSKTAKKAG
jgi:hypothetical protein